MCDMKREGLKFTFRPRQGYRRIVCPDNARLRLIEFGTINLARGESVDLPLAGREVAVTLLRGRLSAECGRDRFAIGPRKNIFEEGPWAIYARGIDGLALVARSRVEALVSSAPAPRGKAAVQTIKPSDIIERTVGAGTYKRSVRTIIGEDFQAERLLIGETINQAGKWSSYPPHRHENNSPPDEAKLEEVYYYKLEKPNGFGVQRIYTDDGRIDETHTVRDGDLCVLPRGYHPVAAAPNSRLYYFWALAGKNRKMLVRVDPHFA
ncbi:MAG: 5-deoxy-glucuronate isomerase [Candidatus Abyssubacteria bacterium]|nr:5-deoxy-glucuronate isomerase [Candidatus Abyssubacteria bacterium]